MARKGIGSITIADISDGAPSTVPGPSGQSVKTVFLFKKNDSDLTSNTFGSFADPKSGAEDGWDYNIPGLSADGDKVYVTYRIFTSDGLAPQTATWSTPTIYSQRKDGAASTVPGPDGARTISGYIYASVTAGDTAPTLPSGGTYDFDDGSLTFSSNAASWSQNIPTLDPANDYYAAPFAGVENDFTNNTATVTVGTRTTFTQFTGLVTFTDLSTQGNTTIHGSNITTGTIDASVVNVTNINASNISSGTVLIGRLPEDVKNSNVTKTSLGLGNVPNLDSTTAYYTDIRNQALESMNTIISGVTNLSATANQYGGAVNEGEIDVSSGAFKVGHVYRSFTNSSDLYTAFEPTAPAGYDGKFFYIISGEKEVWGTAAEVTAGTHRFEADTTTQGQTGSAAGLFVALYDHLQKKWYACTNVNGVNVEFTPLDSDYIIAYGQWSTNIDYIQFLGEQVADPSISTGGQWFSLTGRSNTAAPTDGVFLTNFGRLPLDRDVVTVTDTTGASKGYLYTGGAWTEQSALIAGNMVVDGTITASEIAAGTITASKLSVEALQLVNPASYTNNANRWGGISPEGVVPDYPTGISFGYDATEDALKLTSDGDVGLRSSTWLVDHNAIYKVSCKVRKDTVGGSFYVGVGGLTGADPDGGLYDGGNAQGNTTIQLYDANRVATTSGTNVYIASGTASTSYMDFTFYIIGANRNVNEAPDWYLNNFTALTPFAKLNSGAQYAFVRFLNWSNGTTVRTLYVKDVSVTEVGTGTIVAANIKAETITGDKIKAGTITADKIDISDVISVGSFPTAKPTFLSDATNGKTVTISGNTISTGTPDSNSWDTHVYTKEGFDVPCTISFRITTPTLRVMVGLNKDPLTSKYFDSIDYAWYTNAGTTSIYEAGVPQTITNDSITAEDIFSIEYTGSAVKYYFNNVERRSVAASLSAGQKFYFDTSFYDGGLTITDVTFGPSVDIASGSLAGITITPSEIRSNNFVPGDAGAGFRIGSNGIIEATDGVFRGEVSTNILNVSGDMYVAGAADFLTLLTNAKPITYDMLDISTINEIQSQIATVAQVSNGDFASSNNSIPAIGATSPYTNLAIELNGFNHGTQAIEVLVRSSTTIGSSTTSYTTQQRTASFKIERKLSTGSWATPADVVEIGAYSFVVSEFISTSGYYHSISEQRTFEDIGHAPGSYDYRVRFTSIGQFYIDMDNYRDVPFTFSLNEEAQTTGSFLPTSGGTLTGALTVPTLNVTSDLNITGNINSYNVTDLDVTDTSITLNAGGAALTADGAGIYIEKAVDASTNASITWNATSDIFLFSHGLHVNSNTASSPLSIGRGATDGSQVVKIGVFDTAARFTYIEDTTSEGNGNFGTYQFNLGGNNGEAEVTALTITKTGISSPNLNIANWDTAYTDTSGATNANTASKIVKRDASGNFTAGTITATLSGNATSATSAGKWTTSRNLTIGSTAKSVDGSANVSWTLAEIGAASSGHSHSSFDSLELTGLGTNGDPGTDDLYIGGYGIQGSRANAPIYVHNHADGGVRITDNSTLGSTGGLLVKATVTTCNGLFTATSKSFTIDHPTKEGYKLRYGSLEGPENGVYVRGVTTSNVIELPEYWPKLVHEESITVQLTAVGHSQKLIVEKVEDNKVYIRNANWFRKAINASYVVYAERKDIDKITVEFKE